MGIDFTLDRLALRNKPSFYSVERKAVVQRDGCRCRYCGTSGQMTVDHIVPRSRGGSDDRSNMVAACPPCNIDKGDLSLDEWRDVLRREKRPSRLIAALIIGNIASVERQIQGKPLDMSIGAITRTWFAPRLGL